MKKYFLLAVLLLGSGSVLMAATEDKAIKTGEAVAAKVEEVKAAKIEEVKVAKVEEVKAVAKEAVAPVEAPKPPAPPAAPVDDRLAALNQRMANNASLKDADKSALAAAMAAHYPSGADLRAPENEKAMLFFESAANDPNMKVNEKLDAIKKYDPKAVAVEKPAEEAAAPAKAVVETPVKAAAKVKEVKAAEKKEKKTGGFSFFNKK